MRGIGLIRHVRVLSVSYYSMYSFSLLILFRFSKLSGFCFYGVIHMFYVFKNASILPLNVKKEDFSQLVWSLLQLCNLRQRKV